MYNEGGANGKDGPSCGASRSDGCAMGLPFGWQLVFSNIDPPLGGRFEETGGFIDRVKPQSPKGQEADNP